MRVSAPFTLPKPSDNPARKPEKALGMRQTAERLSENSQNLGEGSVAHRSAKFETLIFFAPFVPVSVGRSAHKGATYVRR